MSVAHCICLNRSPEDYDGPLEDCPVHGVKACLIRSQSDLADAHTMIGSLGSQLKRAEDFKAKWRRQAETATDLVESLRAELARAQQAMARVRAYADDLAGGPNHRSFIADQIREALAADAPAATEVTS